MEGEHIITDRYCNYCKKYTKHNLKDDYNQEGTGGSLICLKCGSSRIDLIQGFNANLM